MSRTAWILLLNLALLSGPARAAERALSLNDAVKAAIEHNPELKVAAADVAAAEARRRGASVLFQQNPELSGAIGPRAAYGGRSIDYEVQVSQPIEVGGQRGARVAAADAAIASASERLRQRRTGLIADVRTAYAAAAAGKDAVSLATEAAQLAEQSLRTAELRFDAGDASRLDVNAARVELGRARRAVRSAQQDYAEALGVLRRLVAVAPDDVVSITDSLIDAARWERSRPTADGAVNRHAAVLAEERAVDEARAELSLANREVVPTPRLGVAYSREEDAQILQGTLALEIPLFNQNQGARGVSAAKVTQAERALDATRREVATGLQVALTRRENAERAVAEFASELLAAAQENLQLINEAYAAGKVDFLQLLLVRRDTIETRSAHIEALYELAAANAQLSTYLGEESLR